MIQDNHEVENDINLLRLNFNRLIIMHLQS